MITNAFVMDMWFMRKISCLFVTLVVVQDSVVNAGWYLLYDSMHILYPHLGTIVSDISELFLPNNTMSMTVEDKGRKLTLFYKIDNQFSNRLFGWIAIISILTLRHQQLWEIYTIL